MENSGSSSPVGGTEPARNEPAPAPPRPPRWLIVLVFLGLFLLLAVLLEWGSRIYLKKTRGYDGDHLYQFVYDPYKAILPAPDFIDTRGVRHNSVGFRRSEEVSKEPAPGTYRIFLMGGSTAYGLGTLWTHIYKETEVLTNDQTIDHYLEQQLSAALPGRHIEVINAAITSAWTHQHLIYLNQTIMDYHPDMVLFLDGFNDFFYFNESHDQFADYDYNSPARRIMGDPTFSSLAYANGWWLFRKSAFAHLMGRAASKVKMALSGRPKQVPMDVEKTVATQRRVFARSALQMHRRIGLILRDAGITPVFMMQPMLSLNRTKPMNENERALFDFNIRSWRPNYEQYIHRAVATSRELETAMSREIGAEFIDLTGIYDSTPGQMFTDYCHLTPAGNELLAQQVSARILPLIRGAAGSPADSAGTRR
jgi:hypothetical protein